VDRSIHFYNRSNNVFESHQRQLVDSSDPLVQLHDLNHPPTAVGGIPQPMFIARPIESI